MEHCYQCKRRIVLIPRKFASKQFCSKRCLDQYNSDVHATTSDLVRRIHKLQWMGMEEEAKDLRKELEQWRATAVVNGVLATPSETD